jgi:hypothetical protein
MRTNCSLTMYNKYIDATTRTEKYQRSSVVGVAWENRKASNTLATGGSIAADQARVFIPLQRGANYLKAKAWQALTVKTGKWTLQVGDVIVKGLVSDEIHDAVVSPPLAAFTITSLKAKYDDVLVISSVDTMDSGSASMHHFMISAK